MSTESKSNSGHIYSTGISGSGWVRQMWAFVDRNLREMRRSLAVLVWSMGFPAGFYLLTINVFMPTDQIPADTLPTVKATVAVGYGMFGATVVCLNVFGQHLVTDLEQHRYAQFRSLPIRSSADLVGRLVAGELFGLAAFGFVLGVSVLTGAEYTLRGLGAVPVLLVALLLSNLVWLVLALGIATLVREARYANIISISVAMMGYFLTGYNGTSPGMFSGDPTLLNLLPNTLAARIAVYQLLDIGDWKQAGLAPPAMPSDPASLALLAGYGVVVLVVGFVVTNRVLYQRRWLGNEGGSGE
ncbi:ABC transporter permease (plasmid) [Haladaptatus sp. SPP-AMP-3]|uniref:ABC transporter permease n=1 Tax=Haladaptatus sp. SPP-AMP-3 TaxID=3121295 RepID=UPI003C2D135A